MFLVSTASIIAQNTYTDTTDASKQGVSTIDVDLFVNPRLPILYSDIPDTIFVYERLNDNTLKVYDKYIFDKMKKRWFSIKEGNRPCVKVSRNKRKTAKIVKLRPVAAGLRSEAR